MTVPSDTPLWGGPGYWYQCNVNVEWEINLCPFPSAYVKKKIMERFFFPKLLDCFYAPITQPPFRLIHPWQCQSQEVTSEQQEHSKLLKYSLRDYYKLCWDCMKEEHHHTCWQNNEEKCLSSLQLSSELLEDSFLPAWWNADETPVKIDCASESNYSHRIGELNGDTKLIIVVRV